MKCKMYIGIDSMCILSNIFIFALSKLYKIVSFTKLGSDEKVFFNISIQFSFD